MNQKTFHDHHHHRQSTSLSSSLGGGGAAGSINLLRLQSSMAAAANSLGESSSSSMIPPSKSNHNSNNPSASNPQGMKETSAGGGVINKGGGGVRNQNNNTSHSNNLLWSGRQSAGSFLLDSSSSSTTFQSFGEHHCALSFSSQQPGPPPGQSSFYGNATLFASGNYPAPISLSASSDGLMQSQLLLKARLQQHGSGLSSGGSFCSPSRDLGTAPTLLKDLYHNSHQNRIMHYVTDFKYVDSWMGTTCSPIEGQEEEEEQGSDERQRNGGNKISSSLGKMKKQEEQLFTMTEIDGDFYDAHNEKEEGGERRNTERIAKKAMKKKLEKQRGILQIVGNKKAPQDFGLQVPLSSHSLLLSSSDQEIYSPANNNSYYTNNYSTQQQPLLLFYKHSRRRVRFDFNMVIWEFSPDDYFMIIRNDNTKKQITNVEKMKIEIQKDARETQKQELFCWQNGQQGMTFILQRLAETSSLHSAKYQGGSNSAMSSSMLNPVGWWATAPILYRQIYFIDLILQHFLHQHRKHQQLEGEIKEEEEERRKQNDGRGVPPHHHSKNGGKDNNNSNPIFREDQSVQEERGKRVADESTSGCFSLRGKTGGSAATACYTTHSTQALHFLPREVRVSHFLQNENGEPVFQKGNSEERGEGNPFENTFRTPARQERPFQYHFDATTTPPPCLQKFPEGQEDEEDDEASRTTSPVKGRAKDLENRKHQQLESSVGAELGGSWGGSCRQEAAANTTSLPPPRRRSLSSFSNSKSCHHQYFEQYHQMLYHHMKQALTQTNSAVLPHIAAISEDVLEAMLVVNPNLVMQCFLSSNSTSTLTLASGDEGSYQQSTSMSMKNNMLMYFCQKYNHEKPIMMSNSFPSSSSTPDSVMFFYLLEWKIPSFHDGIELLRLAVEECKNPLMPHYIALPLLFSAVNNPSQDFTLQKHIQLTAKYDTTLDTYLGALIEFALNFSQHASSRQKYLRLDEFAFGILATLMRDVKGPPFSSLFENFTKQLLRAVVQRWPTNSTIGLQHFCACVFYGALIHSTSTSKVVDEALLQLNRYIVRYYPRTVQPEKDEKILIVLVTFVLLFALTCEEKNKNKEGKGERGAPSRKNEKAENNFLMSREPEGGGKRESFLFAVTGLREVTSIIQQKRKKIFEKHRSFSWGESLKDHKTLAHWFYLEERFDGGFGALMLGKRHLNVSTSTSSVVSPLDTGSTSGMLGHADSLGVGSNNINATSQPASTTGIVKQQDQQGASSSVTGDHGALSTPQHLRFIPQSSTSSHNIDETAANYKLQKQESNALLLQQQLGGEDSIASSSQGRAPFGDDEVTTDRMKRNDHHPNDQGEFFSENCEHQENNNTVASSWCRNYGGGSCRANNTKTAMSSPPRVLSKGQWVERLQNALGGPQHVQRLLSDWQTLAL